MPYIVGRTPTWVLISCEYLVKVSNNPQQNREYMEKNVCCHCGYMKDAANKGVPLVCLHPQHDPRVWSRFMKALHQQAPPPV